MDIIQEFIKASLKEANRSEVSVAYNTNISKTERLAIILAKSLNGKILKKDMYSFSLLFSLPQNYNLRVHDGVESISGYILLNEKEVFHWNNIFFVKGENLDYLTKEAKSYEEKYNVPMNVSLAAIKIFQKIISIRKTFLSQDLPDINPTGRRAITRARYNLEKYKKDRDYYNDLFIESGVLSEEDLAKYIISIKPEECNDPDWNLDYDGGSATFNNKIAFIFRDKTTKARYKLIYDVRFTASADGWSSSGSYWDPPDGEEWLTGNIYDDIEADFNDIKADEPLDEVLEDHLINIIDDFVNSSMLTKYIEDNLKDVTACDVK